MYSFLNKYGQALAFGLGIVVTLIFLAIIFSDPATDTLSTMSDEDKYNSSMFNFGLGTSILMTVLAAAGMLLFGVTQIFGNLKGSLKGIIGLGVVVALLLIAISATTGEPDHPQIQTAIDKFEDAQGTTFTAGNMKFIGGSIITALVMMAASFVVLIVFGVRNFFK